MDYNQDKTNAHDALGRKLVIGETYGYSADRNGFCRVTVGTLTKIHDTGMVSLKPMESKRGLYGYEPEEKVVTKAVTVKGMKLFPVDLNV